MSDEVLDVDVYDGCPRCGAEITWIAIFDSRPEDIYAMCTQCTWGED